MTARSTLVRLVVAALLLAAPAAAFAANSLSLGADYLVRDVNVVEDSARVPNLSYVDQQIKAYLITDLSKDVEATLRVQSIQPWGFEPNSPLGSTTTTRGSLGSRYPYDNGALWIQNAFVRLPNLLENHAVATIGRQPIKWGDGYILSDDDLGFNAVRFQAKSPLRWLPVDLDAFTAKVDETLSLNKDTDLHGASIGFDHNLYRWDFMGLWEKQGNVGEYEAGGETAPVNASTLDRMIYGARFRINLRDAFVSGEYYQQGGSVKRAAGQDINLKGNAYAFGIGGKQNSPKWGRFGARLDYLFGSGDDPKTTGDDEAFRADFATRWSGLERTGFGQYAGANFSDIRSSTAPFSPASSVNSGLPPGTSGIQTIHLGLEATPFTQWTLQFDYCTFKADKNLSGKKDIGTELDYGVVYRFSGLVTFRGSYNEFIPKWDDADRQKAHMGNIEADVRF